MQDIKPSLEAGGKIYAPPTVNLEEQILKFISAVQLAAKSMESFLRKAALQIENLLKRSANNENLGFALSVEKVEDGSFLCDILIGNSISLSKLIKPTSSETLNKSEATKKFLRFCLDEMLAVNVNTEKDQEVAVEKMRIGFHTIQSSILKSDVPQLKQIASPLKKLAEDFNEKKLFSSIFAICKSHNVKVDIEVQSDFAEKVSKYCLNIGKNKVFEISFFVGKTSLPQDGFKAGKLSDKHLRNVFLKNFLSAITSNTPTADPNATSDKADLGTQSHFYMEFTKKLNDTVGSHAPSAADVDVALRLTAVELGKPLTITQTHWEKSFSLQMEVDDTPLYRKSYEVPSNEMPFTGEDAKLADLYATYHFTKGVIERSSGNSELSKISELLSTLKCKRGAMKDNDLPPDVKVEMKSYEGKAMMQVLWNGIMLWSKVVDKDLSYNRAFDRTMFSFRDKLKASDYFKLHIESDLKFIEFHANQDEPSHFPIAFDVVPLLPKELTERKMNEFLITLKSRSNIQPDMELLLKSSAHAAGLSLQISHSFKDQEQFIVLRLNDHIIIESTELLTLRRMAATKSLYTKFHKLLCEMNCFKIDLKRNMVCFSKDATKGFTAFQPLFSPLTPKQLEGFLRQVCTLKDTSKSQASLKAVANDYGIVVTVASVKGRFNLTLNDVIAHRDRHDDSGKYSTIRLYERCFENFISKVNRSIFYRVYEGPVNGRCLEFLDSRPTNASIWLSIPRKSRHATVKMGSSLEDVFCLPELTYDAYDFPLVLSQKDSPVDAFLKACNNEDLMCLSEMLWTINLVFQIEKVDIGDDYLAVLSTVAQRERRSLKIECSYAFNNVASTVDIVYSLLLDNYELFRTRRLYSESVITLKDEEVQEHEAIQNLCRRFVSKVGNNVYLRFPVKSSEPLELAFAEKPLDDHRYTSYRFDAFCKPRFLEEARNPLADLAQSHVQDEEYVRRSEAVSNYYTLANIAVLRKNRKKVRFS